MTPQHLTEHLHQLDNSILLTLVMRAYANDENYPEDIYNVLLEELERRLVEVGFLPQPYENISSDTNDL